MERMKIYRMRDVCDTTGLKPSTIYKLVRQKEFPRPIRLTARSAGWSSDAVAEWVNQKLGGQK